MYDPQALLEIHRRTHLGSAAMLGHCAGFSAAELARELPGFGYPSLLEQWRHIIGAEDYWLNVLLGDWDIPDHAAACCTIPELEERRAVVARQAEAFLAGQTAGTLSTPRNVSAWPEGRVINVVPALVVLRTLTHAFQHRGQVFAMCRLLGKPCPEANFPLLA